jgi:hypothetical protein
LEQDAMGKKTPKAPAAPDPVATANAQAAANTTAATTQANLNRINQVTPEGTLSYSIIGKNPDGTPQYQQTQTYSPTQQALYDSTTNTSIGLNNLANQNVARVQQAQATPFSYDGMTPLQTQAAAGALQYGTPTYAARDTIANAGKINTGYDTGGTIRDTFDQGGPLTYNVQGGEIKNQIADAGAVQRSLDFGGKFDPGDFNQAAQKASDSAYAAAASRLDPQYAQQEANYRARLANSGITENSAAYRREMDNFARARTDAYGQAQNNAFGQGLAAQNQGYGQSLSTRQQNSGEIATAGNFANAAQGQVFGQNAQQLAAFNAAQQQQFGQGYQNANLNNAAQGQQWQQNYGAAQFGNDAQQQRNQQNAQYAAFGNAAQDQQYSQNMNDATFYNQAQDQNFGQAQANAAMYNTAQNQAYNQSAGNVALNNQARQQQIQEAAYLRNLPLNDIQALQGVAGGVQQPQFQNVSQVGVAAPDYQGAVYKNYDAANQQYQAAQQARSAGLGSIFGLAGSLGSAALTKAPMFSDIRLKENIKRIGTLANGLATYAFNYIGNASQQFGVMAQEALNVVPDAVSVADNGYLMVDYSKVW